MMENTEKKYYERSYKLALENTKYNSEGKAVITLDDEREQKDIRGLQEYRTKWFVIRRIIWYASRRNKGGVPAETTAVPGGIRIIWLIIAVIFIV